MTDTSPDEMVHVTDGSTVAVCGARTRGYPDTGRVITCLLCMMAPLKRQCGHPNAVPTFCPYSRDVDDEVVPCECCAECSHECAQDV